MQHPVARIGQIHYFFRYFETFLQHNNFTARNVFFKDVVDLMKDQKLGSFLHDAVLSLGAMQAVKLGAPAGFDLSQSYNLAMCYYSKSVLGLRHALDRIDQLPNARHGMLWTTHLLGLFELMSDSTGQGWIQHLVHGTSKALVAAGPSACELGLGQRFFTEIRIFEVCRAIIFNQPTFLADPEWRRLTEKMPLAKGTVEAPSLDELLDIIVLCSTLRVRASSFVRSLVERELASSDEYLDDAYSIVQEGFHLRQALVDWEARESSYSSDSFSEGGSTVYDNFTSLAGAFFSATSIYLSGVFDYETTHWQEMGIIVPNLGEEEIQVHVASILAHTDTILNGSSISPLLVLFPLRVAGARSCESWQQECITQHLAMVERTFPVASDFRADLGKVWSRRSFGG
ncbi:hypothetical protein FSARC_7594 [Fusarium sarcochroum]|uniref:Uncharacterized protein n=1 Tax=Fusarium sarcochroum TaxID=1208366 RepID=A0A8H4TUX8_9HYPO|nr:hypothetical protein FSARC_7594 [Fusarium sarcochroum]